MGVQVIRQESAGSPGSGGACPLPLIENDNEHENENEDELKSLVGE
jgi:hypothetical protein